MYARGFFGLKQEPFSIAPDPRYLYMSERHREALAHLLYGVQGGGGFVLLTGEIGAGKTTVCRCFLEQIPKRCNVAYIFNPKLTCPELLRTVCDEFGLQPGRQPTVKDYVDPLNAFLLRTPRGGPEQRADHRRGAEPLGRGAGAAAPADQPGDRRRASCCRSC
jgi:general secretion pathway protein A